MADVTNDNQSGMVIDAPRPDAHGQAAILLVESLIHSLIDKSVISMGDALDMVEVATDVLGEIAVDLGDPPEATLASQTLLAAIGKSLKNDQ